MDIEKNYTNYSLFDEIDELDTQKEKKYVYRVNEGLDGFYMINDDISLKPYIILFVSGGLIGISLEDVLKKKKRKLLELK